jgi:thiol-disulfide isomerase/thioredoxin
MLHRIIICVLSCIIIAALVSGCASGPRIGSLAPAFTSVDLAGRPVASQDSDGNVLVLYFWATWCAPCAVSGPGMQRIHQRYQSDGRVSVIGVHYDDKGNPEEYTSGHGYGFTVIPRGGEVVRAYGIKKIPAIVVVGRGGTVLHNQVGYGEGDDETIAALIDAHLRSVE